MMNYRMTVTPLPLACVLSQLSSPCTFINAIKITAFLKKIL